MDLFFVVRAKTKIKAKELKCKRRLPKNMLSDCEIELTGVNSCHFSYEQDYIKGSL